jgi:hypothetical protein
MLVDDFQWRGFLIVHQHRRTSSSTDAAHQASSRKRNYARQVERLYTEQQGLRATCKLHPG